jgi:hypothetical protein
MHPRMLWLVLQCAAALALSSCESDLPPNHHELESEFEDSLPVNSYLLAFRSGRLDRTDRGDTIVFQTHYEATVRRLNNMSVAIRVDNIPPAQHTDQEFEDVATTGHVILYREYGQWNARFVPTHKERARALLTEEHTGSLWEGRDSVPFRLRLSQYDSSANLVTGQIVYPSLASASKRVSGRVRENEVVLTETEWIYRPMPDVRVSFGLRYRLHLGRLGEIRSGEWWYRTRGGELTF